MFCDTFAKEEDVEDVVFRVVIDFVPFSNLDLDGKLKLHCIRYYTFFQAAASSVNHA